MLSRLTLFINIMLVFLLTSTVLSSGVVYGSVEGKSSTDLNKDISQQYGRISEEKDILLDSLPNGLALLPDPNESRSFIFSFRHDDKMQWESAELSKNESEDEFLTRIKKHQKGDLILNNNKDIGIFVSSTQVQSLGEGLLADLLKKPIEPVFEIQRRVPARLGYRYLVKTVYGQYGLFRVLAVTKRAVLIQWIYQPDGSTMFKGTGNFLDRKIANYNYWGGDLTMNSALLHLKRLGIRVCFETAIANSNEDIQHVAKDIKDINNVNIKILLDGLLKTTNRYGWEAIEGTNIICIYPKSNSFLNKTVKKSDLKIPITNRSWLSIIDEIQLDKYKIRFPNWIGLTIFNGRRAPSPPDRNISVNTDSDYFLKNILSKICWAYGDGMYFSLGYLKEGKKGLIFETTPILHELALLEDKPVSDTLEKWAEPTKKELLKNIENKSAKNNQGQLTQTNMLLSVALPTAVGLAVVVLAAGGILLYKKKSKPHQL
jgi:hypothetical protein